MALAISRDARLAQLRQLLHERSATLSNLVPGTAAHDGLTKECDAIYAAIRQLETSTNLSPKAVLMTIGIALLIAWSLIH